MLPVKRSQGSLQTLVLRHARESEMSVAEIAKHINSTIGTVSGVLTYLKKVKIMTEQEVIDVRNRGKCVSQAAAE